MFAGFGRSSSRVAPIVGALSLRDGAGIVKTYDRGWLWSLDWKSVWLDWSAGTSLLGGLVLTLDSGFLGDRHVEVR